MKFQNLKNAIIEQFKVTNRIIPFVMGAPGGGKSALAREIGRDFRFADGGGFDRVIEFTPSLRDVVDLLGTPNNNGDVTRWVPPEELAALRTGRNLFIVEELSDSNIPMMNGLCGLFLDRKLNNVILSDETYIIATGNRTEDKSGANRVTSKLANRVRRYDFEENLDDWCDWAFTQEHIPVEMIQFLRFKPNLLMDFVPDRFANPTPRQWEKAAYTPVTLPDDQFMDSVAGDVGAGAAAEYTAFRKIAAGLPSIDAILMNPATHDVPEDIAVRFALIGALAQRTEKDNIDRLIEFTNRLPTDFNVMYMNDVIKLKPEVKTTKAFVSWAVKNANVLV